MNTRIIVTYFSNLKLSRLSALFFSIILSCNMKEKEEINIIKPKFIIYEGKLMPYKNIDDIIEISKTAQEGKIEKYNQLDNLFKQNEQKTKNFSSTSIKDNIKKQIAFNLQQDRIPSKNKYNWLDSTKYLYKYTAIGENNNEIDTLVSVQIKFQLGKLDIKNKFFWFVKEIDYKVKMYNWENKVIGFFRIEDIEYYVDSDGSITWRLSPQLAMGDNDWSVCFITQLQCFLLTIVWKSYQS